VPTPTVHRLKITLRGIRPPIWRRIEVPTNLSLFELSAVLEAAMGWLGGHLHAYDAGGVTYQLPDDYDSPFGRRIVDERKARLGRVLPSVGAKMTFDYDFGDGWQHDVVVEAIGPGDKNVTYPRCVTGRRACPPDDCGGPWGYGDLLEVLADPNHPEHAARLEWCGGPLDPEAFDIEATNTAMQHAEA
jgi:Plasmid pRiA4b ORF-3-like protein